MRGPVLFPPCILHLPFGIAGALQEVPFLVFAPHLGALFGFPRGLPFLNSMRLVAWGSSALFLTNPPSPLVDSANDCLSTLINVHMLNNDFLLASRPISLKGFHLGENDSNGESKRVTEMGRAKHTGRA